MAVEVTPDPSEEERQAIVRALELEREHGNDPSPWWKEGLLAGDDDYATAPPRQSRGATRA